MRCYFSWLFCIDCLNLQMLALRKLKSPNLTSLWFCLSVVRMSCCISQLPPSNKQLRIRMLSYTIMSSLPSLINPNANSVLWLLWYCNCTYMLSFLFFSKSCSKDFLIILSRCNYYLSFPNFCMKHLKNTCFST